MTGRDFVTRNNGHVTPNDFVYQENMSCEEFVGKSPFFYRDLRWEGRGQNGRDPKGSKFRPFE